MPSALILIADGTEEIEFVTPYDGQWLGRVKPLHTCLTPTVLIRAGFDVKSAGVNLQKDWAT